MKQVFTSLFFIIVLCQVAEAKIWRINNNTGIIADFNNLNTAINTGTVVNGDTLYVEPSPNGYGGCQLSKKLTIIGAGYFLSETAPMIANPKTQASSNISYIGYVDFLAGSAGSVVSGCYVDGGVTFQDNKETIQRCVITSYLYLTSGSGNTTSDTIRQNYITAGFYSNGSGSGANYIIYNNIITGSQLNLGGNINNINGYFINNNFVYYYSSSPGNSYGPVCSNFVFQNNLFGFVNFGAYQSSNVFFNNICNGTGIPSGNSNQQNIDVAANVVNDWTGNGAGFSTDGRWQLKSNSTAAHNTGLINGATVDCGAFGGPAPYILSGMPNIPSIYALSVPAQVNSGTLSMNITLSSTSH